MDAVTGRPGADEASPYYFRYFDRVPDGDILAILESQSKDFRSLLEGITEERSLYRYAPDKWSLRQVLNHVNDTERLFVFRALWFARGFDSPLPSFDQDVSVRAAEADRVSWAGHVEEWRGIREASLAFFRNLPQESWTKRGVASGNPFSVRACAYFLAGHADHHDAIIRERYK